MAGSLEDVGIGEVKMESGVEQVDANINQSHSRRRLSLLTAALRYRSSGIVAKATQSIRRKFQTVGLC